MSREPVATRLVARDVAASRGDLFALRLDDLALGSGEALVLTGPNGAGKSTLLRVLAGLLPRMAGALSFDGIDPHEDRRAYAGRLHFVGHKDAVKGAFTVAETMRHWARLLGEEDASRLRPALACYGLEGLAELPAAYLSAGQRRRLALARTLAVPRALWLLDEPASGLDIAGRAALSEAIARHRKDGGVIVMASHGELALDAARELALGDAA